jgi:disulfide bond formation protein DsbB
MTSYALSCWTTKQRKVVINLFTYALCVPALFFCLSPYVIIDHEQMLKDLYFETHSDFVSVTGLDFFGNFSYYLTEVMPFCMGWILTLAALLGLIVVMTKRRSNLSYSFVIMLLGFFVGTSLNPRHWYRWLLPMIPGCAMLAGLGLVCIFDLIVRLLSRSNNPQRSKKIALTVVSMLFLLSVIQPLESDYLLELDKLRPCGLQQMWSYIRDHIPPGTKIACDLDWRWTGGWLYNIQESVWRSDYIPPRPHNYRTPFDIAKDGYQYMVCEGWNRIDYQQKADKYPLEAHFYDELRKHVPLLYATKMNSESFPGVNPYNRYGSYELYDLRGLLHKKVDPNEQLNPP